MGSARIKLVKLFAFTIAILILFAAGLAVHGIHELQEAGIVPFIIGNLWDINPLTYNRGKLPAIA